LQDEDQAITRTLSHYMYMKIKLLLFFFFLNSAFVVKAYENSAVKVLLYTLFFTFYLLQGYLDYLCRWHWTTRMYRLTIGEFKLVWF